MNEKDQRIEESLARQLARAMQANAVLVEDNKRLMAEIERLRAELDRK